MWRMFFFSAPALVAISLLALAETVTVTKVPCPQTSPASGEEMYVSYCASCHGVDGKGGGPAAEALKVPPSNLTAVSSRNSGKFPTLHVQAVIQGDSSMVAHGSKDMPVWGPIFRRLSRDDEGVLLLRVANLTKHIESLQAR
jgi:mono/diheme cytochrome c family protein